MPHYPLPIPDHVIEAVDAEEGLEPGEPWFEQRVQNRAAIGSLWGTFNTIYDSGVPLFSKDAIRDLVRQIDESGVRPVQTEPVSLRFSVTGIDGKAVEMPVKLGVKRRARRDLGDDVELITALLDVEFRPIDHLTSIAAINVDDFDPDKAFLSMIVRGLTVPVRTPTGEVVLRHSPHPAPETRALLQQQRESWDASDASKHILTALAKLADAGSLPRVDKVVAFACASPSDAERAEHSATEHALVLSLRDFFSRQQQQQPTTTRIPCYTQEPRYQDVDRELLGELGMTVLDHPRGFLEVDESTAVFSQSPDAPVRQVVADIARPALMIWNKVRDFPREGYWVGRAEQSDNISPRVEDMVRNHYTELPFPADLAGGFGSLLAIYVRKD